jgi:hypothetical protein
MNHYLIFCLGVVMGVGLAEVLMVLTRRDK